MACNNHIFRSLFVLVDFTKVFGFEVSDKRIQQYLPA